MHRKTGPTIHPNVCIIKCLFLSSHRVFYICMLQAGRSPVLAVATTLEQMSHLVCVISVVRVTSWSLSNTPVSWHAVAHADPARCVYVYAKRLQFQWMLVFVTCVLVYMCLLSFCIHKVYLFSQMGRRRTVKLDDYRTWPYCIYEKHYTVRWSQNRMGAAILDANTASGFYTSPSNPSRHWWYSWLSSYSY